MPPLAISPDTSLDISLEEDELIPSKSGGEVTDDSEVGLQVQVRWSSTGRETR